MLQNESARSAGVSALVALSKAVVIANTSGLSEGLPVVPGFKLIFLRNDGITLGLFGRVPRWVLTPVALAVNAWLLWMMWRAARTPEAIACSLIVGGALENVIDQLRFGAVTVSSIFTSAPTIGPRSVSPMSPS